MADHLPEYVNIDHLPDYNCMVYGMYIRYGDAKGKGPTQYLPHCYLWFVDMGWILDFLDFSAVNLLDFSISHYFIVIFNKTVITAIKMKVSCFGLQ